MPGYFDGGSAQPDYVERQRARQRAWYLANREKTLERAKAYYQEHREAVLERHRIAPEHWKKAQRRTGIAETSPRVYRRRYYAEVMVADALRLRYRALQRVSGEAEPTCASCGCRDWRVLHINHLNGGGAVEQRAVGFRRMSAAIVAGERATEDLNVLCANCNTLYEYERGKRRLPDNWQTIVQEEVDRARLF